MRIIDYGESYGRSVTLCAGRYESLHRGHAQIIKKAVEAAKKNGSEVMLMTFDERDNARFGRVILTYPERISAAEKLGVSSVLRIDFTDSFKSVSAEDFLLEISRKLNIAGIFCGYDFRFGKDRCGDAASLKRFCSERNLYFSEIGKIELNGEKISSSSVKKALSAGDIEKANAMLGYAYFISGVVKEGRHDGTAIGFPTANISWPDNKAALKEGVYATRSTIDGKEYAGITNYGTAPTFGFGNVTCETHFKGYVGNLYGRALTLHFDAFLRDIRAFSCIEELKEQLFDDLKKV